MPTGIRRFPRRAWPLTHLAVLAAAAALAGISLAGEVRADGDLIFADGFEDCTSDPQVGSPCDGPDTDQCAEGVFECVDRVLQCNDGTDSTEDLCNGADDDCDGASVDGAEDPLVGTACDGPDSDLCAEGAQSCLGGGLVCNDGTGNTLDVCNGADDDCDPASADGSGDPLMGTACDGADLDACNEGVRTCAGGAPACTDATGDSNQVVDGGFEAGPGAGVWTESSTHFDTPICSVGLCGFSGGTNARSGAYWAWFGGFDGSETAYVRQSLVIPTGTATLTFWLEIVVCDSVGSDVFTVRIDGQTVFTATNTDPACNQIGYVRKTIDVTAFATGGSHMLELRGEFAAVGMGFTDFMVDDVRLESCP
jgi:hypothetical protein